MKFGERIWHAKAIIVDNEIVDYEIPYAITLRPMYLSIMPSGGDFTIQEYGRDDSSKWTGIAYSSFFKNVFHEGDLLYLDGATPNGEIEFGNNANAVIKDVREYNQTFRLNIKSRVSGVGYGG